MCNCVAVMNEYLAPDREIAMVLQISTGKLLGPLVETNWVKRPRGARKNPPKCIASYCPFCGEQHKPHPDGGQDE